KVALQELVANMAISPGEIAYMGDDLPDLPALHFAGLGITVPNGYWLVQQQADYCTRANGGYGAVREACDLILWAQDQLHTTLTPYLDGEKCLPACSARVTARPGPECSRWAERWRLPYS